MAPTGGLSTGLAFLPEWLADGEGHTLDAAMLAWVKAAGWLRAGLVWPIDGAPKSCLAADGEGVSVDAAPPAELPEIAKVIHDGESTAVWPAPGTSDRLYARLAPSGRGVGAIWAERSEREPWTDADRSYLTLAARMIERSAHLARAIGPVLEPHQLERRLKDAATIAGRMAHDFDNILTGIMGFTELSQPLAPAGSQLAKFLGEIRSAGERGIAFTKQLHELSRSAQVKSMPGSVAAVVTKEAARLTAREPKGATVDNRVPPNLAAVAVDAAPLGIVLGHVIENAIQVSPAGATVTVTARAVDLSIEQARTFLGNVSPGPMIEVLVADAGAGIKPETKARLFAEPFHTTKVRHRGLGLAVAYRILFAHRGGIRIDAAVPPEIGTHVRVLFPLASARPAVAPTASLPATLTGD